MQQCTVPMVIGSIVRYSSEQNDLLEKKINLEAFLGCICPFYLRKKRTHCILIKTGKAACVVPAALFLACLAVSGSCWAAAWQAPAGGYGSQSWVWTVSAAAALPVSPGTVSITSESDQEVKNVTVHLTGALLFLFFLLGDLIFPSHFPLSLAFIPTEGVV